MPTVNNLSVNHALHHRHPLQCDAAVIAPDLITEAAEAGMDASLFDDDVSAFLQGGVSTKELIRRRSLKAQSSSTKVAFAILLQCVLFSRPRRSSEVPITTTHVCVVITHRGYA